jgi:hypothetical protein
MARASTLKGVLVSAGSMGVGAIMLASTAAHATVMESWENPADPLDGWTQVNTNFTPAPSVLGVTDGVQSLQEIGTTAGNYGQIIRSPFTLDNLNNLLAAKSISFDNTSLPGAFGFFMQWDVDIESADGGVLVPFTSLDSFSYPGNGPGATATITIPITKAVHAVLAADAASATPSPIQIIIQYGSGDTPGNDIFEIDNLRNDVPVPEPTSMSVIGLSAVSLLGRRRRK